MASLESYLQDLRAKQDVLFINQIPADLSLYRLFPSWTGLSGNLTFKVLILQTFVHVFSYLEAPSLKSDLHTNVDQEQIW